MNVWNGSPGTASALLVTCLFASCLSTAPACSSDSDSSSTLQPAGPPSLSLEEPIEGACTQLYAGDPLTLRARIAVVNWAMRPPGVCGVYPQCGYAVFFVDDQRLVESSSLVTDVPIGSLAVPTGPHMLRVELHDDTDTLALDAAGKPLLVEREVFTAAPGSACDDRLSGRPSGVNEHD